MLHLFVLNNALSQSCTPYKSVIRLNKLDVTMVPTVLHGNTNSLVTASTKNRTLVEYGSGFIPYQTWLDIDSIN